MISSSTKVRPFFRSATRVRAILAILLSLALLSAASSQSTKPKPDRSATSAKIQELSQTVGSLEEHVKMLEQRVISLEEHPRPLIQPSNFNFFGAPWIQWASFWIQWATLIVGALVLCVWYRQMKAMMGQLETMKQQFAAAQQQVRISRNSATFDHVITLVGSSKAMKFVLPEAGSLRIWIERVILPGQKTIWTMPLQFAQVILRLDTCLWN